MKMVHRKVSSEAVDPSLSHGWAYFVETTWYKDHLDSQGLQKETVSHIFITSTRPYDLTLSGLQVSITMP